MTAQDDDIFERRQAVGLVLVVPNAVGRSIDNLVVAAFGLQRFDAAEDRFGFHHHASFAAERVIVHLTVFVECIVPDVMDMDFDQSFLLRPLQNRFIQRALQQFRNDRKDIYAHGPISV